MGDAASEVGYTAVGVEAQRLVGRAGARIERNGAGDRGVVAKHVDPATQR